MDNPSRRDFLQLGWALGVGALVPLSMTACGSSGLTPKETFVEPPILKSVNGLLDFTLTISVMSTLLDGKYVILRSYNQCIPAPTISIQIGDTLRIRVVNKLPPNPQNTIDPPHLRYQNSTNLHTHGLHVTPGLVSPGVYGDYVMDDPSLGVEPGSTRQHEYHIGADHPDGAYWYHPHLHGSTSVQVGSGMAGALKIGGPVDLVPEIAAAKERFFMIQAPISNSTGQLESFADILTNEPPFLINGVRRPTLIMHSGEVQNWHFINAAISNFLNLSLDGHTLNVYSHDGNTLVNMQRILPDPQYGLVMAPGNRDSVLVKAGSPGTYYFRSLFYNKGFPLEGDVLATVIVLPESKSMSLPTQALPVPAVLAPITDMELAQHGGLKRNIVFREVSNKNGAPVTSPPASEVLNPNPGELPDWLYQVGNTSRANTVYAVGSDSEAASNNPGMPSFYFPFQAHDAPKQIVSLGSVEEWTIYNMDVVQHPFHIHINPFWVTKINGVPLDQPYWADTIALPVGGTPENPTSITFRTRFLDYKGIYVLHCHIFSHEDLGMTQAVEVV